MAIKMVDDLRSLIEDVFLTEVEPDRLPRPRGGVDELDSRWLDLDSGTSTPDVPTAPAPPARADPEPVGLPEPRRTRRAEPVAEPEPADTLDTTATPGTTAPGTTGTLDTDGPDSGTGEDVPAESAYIEKWGLPLAVIVIGMFMSVLDTSIVNVAVPAMQKDYNVSAEDIQWVATAYTLVLGVIVPTSAWLGERLGMRRLYVWSLAAFAVFSGLCGVAGDLGPLIVFRILQAVPGGVIPVLCLGILTRIVPPKQIGAAMGMYGFGMVVAPGVGPALGGYLVEYVDWRLIFMINVPIGLLGAVAAQFMLPELRGKKGKSFDVWGFVCVAAGLFAILLAVSKGQDWGWTSYPVLILTVASLLLIGLFVVIELEVREPLLNVRVFANWEFVNSLIVVGLLSTGFFGALYFVPVFLQVGQNITPMNTGLAILPQAIMMMVLMPLAGKAYDRFGARWPTVIGTAIAAVGLFLLSGFDADTRLSQVVVWTMVQATGIGLAFMPAMTAGLAALPESLVDSGNSYSNLIQRVAGALGLSAFTALTMSWAAQNMADYSALLPESAVQHNAKIQEMAAGPTGLIPMFMRAQLFATAHSYATAFLVLGILTALAGGLALMLKAGPPGPGERPIVEMG